MWDHHLGDEPRKNAHSMSHCGSNSVRSECLLWYNDIMSHESNLQGILAEVKVTAYLIENGYDVFAPIGGKTSFDLIGYKDRVIYRIQVKSTTQKRDSGSWGVKICRIRNNNKETKVFYFDPDECDIVAVWIAPEDQVVLVPSTTIKARAEMTVYLADVAQRLERSPSKPDMRVRFPSSAL